MTDEPRRCEQCGGVIRKNPHASRAEHAKRRYCGLKCSNDGRRAQRRPVGARAPAATRIEPELGLRDRRWDERADCRGWPLQIFFGPDGERRAVREAREEIAKGVCGGCPVRAECLEWAVRAGMRYGVFGGTGEAERGEMITRLVRA